jgi:hypothetical protein
MTGFEAGLGDDDDDDDDDGFADWVKSLMDIDDGESERRGLFSRGRRGR